MEITENKQFEAILNANKRRLVVVVWWATWAEPYKEIEPLINELHHKHKDVKIVKVDVDQLSELADSRGIKEVPTFEFIFNKDRVYMFAGPHRHVFLYWFDALRGREVDKFGPEDVIELVRNAPIIEYPWHTELLNNLSGPLTVVVVAILYAAFMYFSAYINPSGGTFNWIAALIVGYQCVKIAMRFLKRGRE